MSLLSDPSVVRLAVVRLRVGLGDLLCSVPALRAVRRCRPDLHVSLVTWPETAPMVARQAAYVDALMPFPGVAGIPERPPDEAAWSAFVRRARADRFDVAVQCYGDNPTANSVAEALGARHLAGFAPDGWNAAVDSALHVPYPTDCHETWRHLRVVRRLGAPVRDGDAALEFPVTPEEDRAADRLRRRAGLRPGGYAVVHPGASSPSRRWPTQRYAALADGLARSGLSVVLTGTSAESEISRRVSEEMAHLAIDLTGGTPLGVLAALIRDSALLVGNDTGTAHLAAAVGTPSVTLFLSGDPARWAHPGARHRTVWVDVGCNPCPHLSCPIEHPCAAAITPGQVLDEAHRALTAGR